MYKQKNLSKHFFLPDIVFPSEVDADNSEAAPLAEAVANNRDHIER
jgi:hypothetical protein